MQKLTQNLEGWENYRSAESDPEVCMDILDRMVRQGWADSYPSVSQAREGVRSDLIVLNRLGLISKQRVDGTLKHRLVWDLQRSGVNGLVRQGELIILPRISDVLNDLTDLHM